MRDTRRFEAIYRAVTGDLTMWVAEEAAAGRLTRVEQQWFEQQLIPGFLAEYTRWPAAVGDIKKYLDAFDAPRVHGDLRLAAHVFLHIAYDLPRVIANTFVAPQRFDPHLGRAVFIRPGPRFLKVFLNEMRRGHFGWIARVGSRWDAAQML